MVAQSSTAAASYRCHWIRFSSTMAANSSSEVERPLAKKRCGGLLSAAGATPQRSSSDSSQFEAVVASGISTDSSWNCEHVRRRDIPERLRPAHWKAFHQAIEAGRTRLGRRALVTRSVHKSGARLYVDLSFAIVQDAAGEDIGLRRRMSASRGRIDRH